MPQRRSSPRSSGSTTPCLCEPPFSASVHRERTECRSSSPTKSTIERCGRSTFVPRRRRASRARPAFAVALDLFEDEVLRIAALLRLGRRPAHAGLQRGKQQPLPPPSLPLEPMQEPRSEETVITRARRRRSPSHMCEATRIDGPLGHRPPRAHLTGEDGRPTAGQWLPLGRTDISRLGSVGLQPDDEAGEVQARGSSPDYTWLAVLSGPRQGGRTGVLPPGPSFPREGALARIAGPRRDLPTSMSA